MLFRSGGALVMIHEELRRDPLGMLDLLSRARVKRLFLPYVALQQLADAAAANPELTLELREIVTAGEQLVVTPNIRAWLQRLNARHGCFLENQYGPSESHVVTAHRLEGAACVDWPSLPAIGSPIQNARIYVLDAARQLLPVGVPGELYIGGVSLARGYLNRQELTDEKFVPNPFVPGERLYRTGDLAAWRANGAVDFLGRIEIGRAHV